MNVLEEILAFYPEYEGQVSVLRYSAGNIQRYIDKYLGPFIASQHRFIGLVINEDLPASCHL